MHCRYFSTTRKGNHSATDTSSGWWATFPSLWNLRSKWPTPFEKCRLWSISAHNVSTVGDSEKSSITMNIELTTGFLTSHRWSAYVTPKCPKGWLKDRFFRFLSKSQRLIVSSAVNLVVFLEIAELARSLCHSWATCIDLYLYCKTHSSLFYFWGAFYVSRIITALHYNTCVVLNSVICWRRV